MGNGLGALLRENDCWRGECESKQFSGRKGCSCEIQFGDVIHLPVIMDGFLLWDRGRDW